MKGRTCATTRSSLGGGCGRPCLSRELFAGELDGGHGRDGLVYLDEASIEDYLECHGFRRRRRRLEPIGPPSRPARTTTGTDRVTPRSRQRSAQRHRTPLAEDGSEHHS